MSEPFGIGGGITNAHSCGCTVGADGFIDITCNRHRDFDLAEDLDRPEPWAEEDETGAPAVRSRPVHLLDWLVPGNPTWCGRGGVTFTAPTTTSPAEVTCKTCIKAYRKHEEREP